MCPCPVVDACDRAFMNHRQLREVRVLRLCSSLSLSLSVALCLCLCLCLSVSVIVSVTERDWTQLSSAQGGWRADEVMSRKTRSCSGRHRETHATVDTQSSQTHVDFVKRMGRVKEKTTIPGSWQTGHATSARPSSSTSLLLPVQMFNLAVSPTFGPSSVPALPHPPSE